MPEPAPSRRWLVWGLRAAVLTIVAAAVLGTFRNALEELSRYELQVRPAWLVVSGLLYAVGLVPMAWFWHRALGALGQPAPFTAVVRAYFLGHLGKYVPGKAMAVILRVAALRRWVPSIRIAMVSALLETLTMMAAGAFWAALIGIVLLRLEARFAMLAAAMALAVGLPTLPPVARRLARLGAKRVEGEKADTDSAIGAFQRIDFWLIAAGWLAASVCWLLLGLSLWATLRAMGIDELAPLAELPLMVATVAFAVVAGFVSMLPGGLGVRDAVLMQLLAPVCGAAGALVAAIVMRLVWLVSELAVCVILYVAARRRAGRTYPDR